MNSVHEKVKIKIFEFNNFHTLTGMLHYDTNSSAIQ